MKTFKFLFISAALSLLIAAPASADGTGKTKPPGTESASSDAWYQPVLDLLSLN